MNSITRRGYRGDVGGNSWPNSPSGEGVISDPFAPRPFSAHIATVGYDYDFHRGVDVVASEGDPLYAPATGAISRRHYTHFGFQTENQMDEFSIDQKNTTMSASWSIGALTLTCVTDINADFPGDCARFYAQTERINPSAGDWVMEVMFDIIPDTDILGDFGIGFTTPDDSEYLAALLAYYADGTSDYFGVSHTSPGGLWLKNDSTSPWLRLVYTQSTNKIQCQRSDDGTNWINISSLIALPAFTASVPNCIPTFFWWPQDSSNVVYPFVIRYFNWVDTSQSIGRFGNWLQVSTHAEKFVMVHFESLAVSEGFVHAGQLLGYSGKTGFDTRSGRVLYEHCHIEYHANNNRDYADTEPINPLGSGVLPRTNVSNNVSAVVTRENDPDGNDSWKLSLSVTRADSDFDLNSISLTGNTTSRTINWNTRSGLNADVDVPVQSGVYIVPQTFNESSLTYDIAIFFNTATVGVSFVSYVVLDTAGTTLTSG